MITLENFKSGGRKALVFLFSAVFVGLLLVGCGCTEGGRLARKPVLSINGREISTQEFADRLALQLKDYDALQAKDEETLARAKQAVADQFIIETLVAGYAKKNKIEVSQAELDEAINKVRARYPDDLAFRRVLAQQNMPFEKWKTDLTKSLLQQKIRTQAATNSPEPSEAEMKVYYDKQKSLFSRPARVQIRQILTDKEDNARRMLEEIRAGKDLGKLAQEYSLAPEASNGGKTGWIEKGTLEVFDTAFKMNVGAKSKVLKSPYGFHIFEVLKKESEAHLSFNDAKAKIKSLLKERRDQEAFMKWLEVELKASKVMRDDRLIDAIQVTTRGS